MGGASVHESAALHFPVTLAFDLTLGHSQTSPTFCFSVSPSINRDADTCHELLYKSKFNKGIMLEVKGKNKCVFYDRWEKWCGTVTNKYNQ